MKKKLLFVAILAIVLLIGLWVYDYLNAPPPQEENGASFTLILIDNSIEDNTTKKLEMRTQSTILWDALLEAQDADKLGSIGETMGFINSIDFLEDKSSQGYYIFMYTSIEEERYLDDFSPPFSYKGATFGACAKGAKEMPIIDGVVYIIAYVYWG